MGELEVTPKFGFSHWLPFLELEKTRGGDYLENCY